ncbi:MAG: hypothetical protein CHACPFDD_02769 [Phycisphaerae bacterium]|nr:hypothetical protein [Phycisphaerae bacterium]
MSGASISVSSGAIAELCRRWQIVELSLFGSALRDDFRPDSDVDVLVTFAPAAPWSTLDLVDLQWELHELFGRPIDLIERSTLRNPFRRRSILANRRILYAA